MDGILVVCVCVVFSDVPYQQAVYRVLSTTFFFLLCFVVCYTVYMFSLCSFDDCHGFSSSYTLVRRTNCSTAIKTRRAHLDKMFSLVSRIAYRHEQ